MRGNPECGLFNIPVVVMLLSRVNRVEMQSDGGGQLTVDRI